MPGMNPQLQVEIVQRLKDELAAKHRGKYLQRVRCPSCGKREAFVSAEDPWMVKCGRENKCGQQHHVRDLWPELFESWSERYGRPDSAYRKAEPNSDTPVADAYLKYGRGFDLALISGWYSQESYYDPDLDAGSAAVRFPLLDGYWQRLIDKPHRFGKKKAHIKPGTSYAGFWWCPPGLVLHGQEELWVVEGIFDAIALLHKGVAAVSSISCNNYPEEGLRALAKACADAGKERPRIVWALDADRAGRYYTQRWVEAARKAGWECDAAQPPMGPAGSLDWNDCLQRGSLEPRDIERYRYYGALLIAQNAMQKALLMYRRREQREFPFEFRRRIYWWKLDMGAYDRAVKELVGDNEGPTPDDVRDQALKQSGSVVEIATCSPTALYFQANPITDESWYYFRIDFPTDNASVKNTFSGSQLASANEFKKRLMAIGPGAMWTGTSGQLDKLLRQQITGIKTVDTIDFVGYSRDHQAWVFGDLAVRNGRLHSLNEEDYFELDRRTSLKTLSQSVALQVNDKREDYRQDWANLIWHAFGAKGIVALAYWLGTLFAEQIRAHQKSYPFLEIVGEAGSGKSTLIEFLWKLLGRRDYEGFDPSKSTMAARARNFAQVSNLPVVLIESDRDQDGPGPKVKQFDWDELKTAYNGRSVRARGHKNQGNDTYEPPFRGAIVISQNAPVNASDAVLQRIVHLQFDKEHQNAETKATAEQMERMPLDQVSGFALQATVREKKVLELFERQAHIYEQMLMDDPGVRNIRIAKNHGQLQALIHCLGDEGLGLLNTDRLAEAMRLTHSMAVERQQALSADHPIVAEFWSAVEYIEGMQSGSVLNHYRADCGQTAINLRHFEALASEHKLRVPPIQELKRHLKASKSRPFVESNRPVRSVQWDGRTCKCWVFDEE